MASVNDIIGSYRLVEELDCGTFGCVYRGEHIIFSDDPVVAIKLLHVHLGAQRERDRFIQEARFLKKLTHPHILPIVGAGIHEGSLYLIVEYAPNRSLKDRLKPGKPLPVEEVVSILSQIGQALQHAHEQNIVHRDLKPANILLNARNEVLLADFGIAVVSEKTQHVDTSGTPPYMAPEQFQGDVSKKSDQYALGCIAYQLLTGQKPFLLPPDANWLAWGYKHSTEQPVAPTQLNPQLPEHIEQAILKAMAKERSERHVDVAAFITALSTPQKTKEQWLIEGNDHYNAGRYEEALAAYEQAIRLDPNYAFAHWGKGNVLRDLKRYEEALAACDRAILLGANHASVYYNKGNALSYLKRYDEALAAYEHALRLDPNNALAYNNKGNTLRNLKRYDEALAAYERAIQLDPNNALAYNNKGNALHDLIPTCAFRYYCDRLTGKGFTRRKGVPMSSLTRAANHLTVEQVKEKLKEAKEVVQYKRWLIVYNALIAPREASEIAEVLAVSTDLVHHIIPLYNREGPQAMETSRAGGRYRATLSVSEEQAFLAPFFERAQTGELATIQEIHQAFELHVGKSVHETTIYRLLDRHGWRKLMPRPRHPKSDPQAQEHFKKTIRRRSRRSFTSESQMTTALSF